jgi:hypothetical protein
MSYAIAPTFEANKIGVRRVYTLSSKGGGLGGAPDALALQMISDGYDISTITTLTDNNATDAQLQFLYDNYGAGSPEFAAAANQLLAQLTGGPTGGAISPGTTPITMQTSAAGTAYGAASSIISVAGQTFDLTQEVAWNSLASMISSWQQQIQQIAAQSPNDPGTVANVAQFNTNITQFANYYQQAMGSSTSPSSMPAISTVTLGIIPVIAIVGIVAIVAGLVAGMYAIYQYFQAKKVQTSATIASQQQAVTGVQASANNLITQANALTAQATAPGVPTATSSALLAQAASLRTQAGALLGQTVVATTPGPAVSSTLTTWFTQNWIGVAAVIIGIAVLPGLVKKL